MSGAGKSTWGFEIERVLRTEFAECAVKAVFLNFFGGAGSGGSDKGAFGRPEITAARELWDAETSKAKTAVAAARIACARAKRSLSKAKSVAAKDDLELKMIELSTQLSLLEYAKALADGRMEEAIKPALAQLLFARGALETSSEQAGNLLDFSSISIEQVIDLLCQQQAQEERKNGEVILYVHLDEAAQLHPAIVKAVVCSLSNYNTGTRKGWVIPIMTHTAPLDWNPTMAKYPLCSLPLYPLTLHEMRESAGWPQGVATDRLLSCTGGHASLLRKLLERCTTQPTNPTRMASGLDAVFNIPVDDLNAVFGPLKKADKIDVLTSIFLQTPIPQDQFGNWPILYKDLWRCGILFVTIKSGKKGRQAYISTPLPYLLVLLTSADIPVTKYLQLHDPAFDPSKAVEVLATIWAACRWATITEFKGVIEKKDFDSFMTEGMGFGVSDDTSQPQIGGFGWYEDTSDDETSDDNDETSNEYKASNDKANDESKKRVAVFIQTKRAQSDNAEQDLSEVETFMKYVVAHSTGRVLAIFATDRQRENKAEYKQFMQNQLLAREQSRAEFFWSDNIHTMIPRGIWAV